MTTKEALIFAKYVERYKVTHQAYNTLKNTNNLRTLDVFNDMWMRLDIGIQMDLYKVIMNALKNHSDKMESLIEEVDMEKISNALEYKDRKDLPF